MLLIERILTLEEMSIPIIMFTYKNENNDERDGFSIITRFVHSFKLSFSRFIKNTMNNMTHKIKSVLAFQ